LSKSPCDDNALLPSCEDATAAKTALSSVSIDSGDDMRPLCRTACSCPNCRDGTNRLVSLKTENVIPNNGGEYVMLVVFMFTCACVCLQINFKSCRRIWSKISSLSYGTERK